MPRTEKTRSGGVAARLSPAEAIRRGRVEIARRQAAARSVAESALKELGQKRSHCSGLTPDSIVEEIAPSEPVSRSGWTASQDAVLRRLWLGGRHTQIQIAAVLSAEFRQPFSRNRVCNRVQVLGLEKRGWRHQDGRASVSLAGAGSRIAESIAPQLVPVADHASLQIPTSVAEPQQPGTHRLTDLGAFRCRFECTGATDPARMRFCGLPTEPGPGNRHGSWCTAHRARVFAPPRLTTANPN